MRPICCNQSSRFGSSDRKVKHDYSIMSTHGWAWRRGATRPPVEGITDSYDDKEVVDNTDRLVSHLSRVLG
eukprot:3137507-Amphidinium_carterae.3